MKAIVAVLLPAVFIGCGGGSDSPTGPEPAGATKSPASKPTALPAKALPKTVRTIHVFVALCDNDSQGIVPVSKTLGDGEDPGNNLYWGAMYGTKTFLKKTKAWKTVSIARRLDPVILERMVLKHRKTGAYLVADAYRGVKIIEAVESFLQAAAGRSAAVMEINGAPLGLYGKADLVAYVGHNGLMDFRVTPPDRAATSDAPRAAIVLACYSKRYFRDTLASYGCKPILLTTGRMAPEAYTLEGAIEAWLTGHGPQGMRGRAALAYNKYQKCGIRAATGLFHAE